MASKQPFTVTKSSAQKTTGSKSTKAAAQRKASTGSSSSSYVGLAGNKPIFSAGTANAAGRAAGQTPTLSLPNGTPAVVPVAPPKIDPFLTPTDESQEAVENGAWDDYISNLNQQRDTNDADVTLKVGDIDRGLSQGLEATDWNSAARGIANSSIKDQTKAQMTTQAAASRGAETDKQTTNHNYVSGQQKQVDTVYKPAIATKYNTLRITNAQKATDGWNVAHPDSPTGPDGGPNPYYKAPAGGVDSGGADGGVAPVGGAVPTLNPSAPSGAQGGAQPSNTGGAVPSAGGSQSQGTTGDWQPVVKDGKFYHYYPSRPAGQQYVYIRPAS